MSIKFDSVISELNISNATLQNWLKTDCLTVDKNGFITTESYNYFKKNILGKHKLNRRANKQHFDKPNSISFELNNNNNAYKSAIQYEQSLSIADKNRKGIYYTPSSVIDDMFSILPALKTTDTFLDPCCGTGNFLIKALKKALSLKTSMVLILMRPLLKLRIIVFIKQPVHIQVILNLSTY